MLDAKFWETIGIDIVACYRRHIFDPDGHGANAEDIHGIPYEEYSKKNEPYNYGTAKKTGKLYRQASRFKNSTAPVLTGDLALSIKGFKKFKSHSTGFGFGSVTQRGKIKQLANMGRVIYTENKPLPDKCKEKLMDELNKDVKDEFKKIRKKIKGKKININIGK